MTDESEHHPVVAGVLALLAVGLTVGLVLGLAALTATRVLGVSNSAGDAQTSRARESLYLPRPAKTTGPSGPLVTLRPDAAQPTATLPSRGGQPGSNGPKKPQISLSASQLEVAPMQQIDLTGIYPGGEGAIVQVQRLTNGRWQDFPVTASVSNQTFSTYVQTGQTGQNRFRVVDTATGVASNEVRVTIG